MDNLKIYQICHDLIDYFATLTSPKKNHLDPIFRTGGSIIFGVSPNNNNNDNNIHCLDMAVTFIDILNTKLIKRTLLCFSFSLLVNANSVTRLKFPLPYKEQKLPCVARGAHIIA